MFLFIVPYAFYLLNALDAADYNCSSLFSLDPFLGAYDIIFTGQVNLINFTNGLQGVPVSVIMGGERQIFDKTSDGKYIHTTKRANSTFSSSVTFELNKPGTARTVNFTFSMINATALQGTYEQTLQDGRITDYVIIYSFSPDASNLWITITVSKPIQLAAFVPFYRLKNGDVGPLTLAPPATSNR
ncbi:uncharacterized protein LOC129585288 [Paramacrobiotus metropolitanus]|uniref:uncharacterized protein LOC129585288 n=1 Tax=Paramacrobiotus metropolitanus TaxID=2943436 RepID=UPI0024460561|nr:uncharacterized protein LOC129585288 [Paramacrobiotus metropolitanus]